MKRIIKRLFSTACNHEFDTKNIEKTNIPEKKKPETNDYHEWMSYYKELYHHPSVANRVKCKCNKCGEVFFADCGLHLKGKLVNG